jgi:hypothetical protein
VHEDAQLAINEPFRYLSLLLSGNWRAGAFFDRVDTGLRPLILSIFSEIR